MGDYDGEREECVCMAHPCWEDGGQRHTCETAEHPHLTFSYDQEGVLSCHCAAQQQASSVYIARDKCPGEHCFESEGNPILDWDPAAEQCVCRAHPCWNLNGERHDCNDPNFPHLQYYETESEEEDGKVEGNCKCIIAMSRETTPSNVRTTTPMPVDL